MSNMSKISALILNLLFIAVSCQQKLESKNESVMTKYEWSEGRSAHPGYPMEIFKGGIVCEGGEWINLDLGVVPGKDGWGSISHGIASVMKSLPKELDFTWMSYAENQFYSIKTEVDINKIKEYFASGFRTKGRNGQMHRHNYDNIVVGMAPGGVVVLWVAGAGVQKEIGKYMGKKVQIPQIEIEQLDSHQNRFFRKDYLNEIYNNGKVITSEMKKKTEGKPIPFGIWDVYRTKFEWRPTFELPENVSLHPQTEVSLDMLNGEREKIDAALKPLTNFEKRAMPRYISMTLQDNADKWYGAESSLNEESCIQAFKYVFGENPNNTQAQFVVKVNEPLSFFTVKLIGENGKEAFIQTEN